MGISASSFSDCLQTDIMSGKYTVCFLLLLKKHSPKVSSRSLKGEGNSLRDNLTAIVVDELHTVETWTGKR